jgi:hypothetical protein
MTMATTRMTRSQYDFDLHQTTNPDHSRAASMGNMYVCAWHGMAAWLSKRAAFLYGIFKSIIWHLSASASASAKASAYLWSSAAAASSHLNCHDMPF